MSSAISELSTLYSKLNTTKLSTSYSELSRPITISELSTAISKRTHAISIPVLAIWEKRSTSSEWNIAISELSIAIPD